MIIEYLNQLKAYVKRTDHKYQVNYKKELVTHPIPFFGNIETAKILTVGVNPSNTEFNYDRKWPREMSSNELAERLLDYFSLEFPAPHDWFNKWEEAVKILGQSYQNGSVAHLDLSPRATMPMKQVSDKKKFLDMVENDIEWFFKLLPLCKNAKLLLVAGSVTKKYYINELIQEFAGNYGFDLLFKFKRGGEAPTFIHKLKGGNVNLPVFFCGVSPSFPQKSHLLVQRVNEKKEKLISYLS